MSLERLKKLEDAKQEHLALSRELSDMKKEALSKFIATAEKEFIDYFTEHGFEREHTRYQKIMKYGDQRLEFSACVERGEIEFEMRGMFRHYIHINHENSSDFASHPAHLCNQAPLADKIAHEENASAALKEAIQNYKPPDFRFTIDKNLRQRSTFTEIIEELLSKIM